MPRQKFDYIVEAVHYSPEGQVAWVRGYERRGPTFSDRVMLDRVTLVARLKAGKRLVVGQRVLLQASTFDVSQLLRVFRRKGQDILATGDSQPEKDNLEGVPII